MRSLFVALALVFVLVGTTSRPADACARCRQGHGHGHGRFTECRDADHGHPDLFMNYYVPPTCGGGGAQMYLAPHYVPPHVGHTYYTYQPLMPHEMLYKHHRSYHRYYNEGRGLTRTSVRWR